MELGTQAWLDRCREAINASQAYREAAQGWRCPLALVFVGSEDEPRRHALFELVDGRCEAAQQVEPDVAADAPVRLSADYDTWMRVVEGRLHPLKAIMLKRVKLDGDLLEIVKYANAARVLFDCVSEVEAEAPSSSAG